MRGAGKQTYSCWQKAKERIQEGEEEEGVLWLCVGCACARGDTYGGQVDGQVR